MALIPSKEEIAAMIQDGVNKSLDSVIEKVTKAAQSGQTRVKGSLTTSFDFVVSGEPK